jgi:hypothetical protein
MLRCAVLLEYQVLEGHTFCILGLAHAKHPGTDSSNRNGRVSAPDAPDAAVSTAEFLLCSCFAESNHTCLRLCGLCVGFAEL